MAHRSPSILIVDDDEAICHLICEGLAEEGYQCEIVLSAEDALIKLDKGSFDVTLLDIRLPGKSGMDLLKSSGKLFKSSVVIMMTAVEDIDIAVKAMQLGASDYLVKPFTINKLNTRIIMALRKRGNIDSFITTNLIMGTPIPGKNAHRHSPTSINALAFGIDAQVDYFDFHSKTVTERTEGLARQLGFPDKEIKKWVKLREDFYSKRDRYISQISGKLE